MGAADTSGAIAGCTRSQPSGVCGPGPSPENGGLMTGIGMQTGNLPST
jgi:hypothetical protein